MSGLDSLSVRSVQGSAGSQDAAASSQAHPADAQDPAGGAGGEADRLTTLLESLVARIDRLERSKAVKERTPTPRHAASAAAASAAPARVPRARSSSGQSVDAFLFGSGDDADDTGDAADEADSKYTAANLVAAGQDSAPPPSGPPTHPLFTRLAPDVIADVGAAGFRSWLRVEAPTETWNNTRNLRECEILAEALDELVFKGDTDAAVEILVRRFVGVRNADTSRNWNFAQVLSKDMPRRTLMRPAVMSAVLREAKNLSLLENGGRLPSARRDGPATANHSGSGSGANNRPAGGNGAAAFNGRGGGGGRRGANNNANPPQAAHGAAAAPAPRAGDGGQRQ